MKITNKCLVFIVCFLSLNKLVEDVMSLVKSEERIFSHIACYMTEDPLTCLV
ncbi:hypothetical protein XNA1_460012 [Xenorhabdus nematophila str. Anatoliense]|nr:hypothetical protein XNA1_4460012 [Xenorhabdus nematophila str. Anatoliense]CEE94338.1 hypothetical protein XNA1_460012 [Xenorhabdus nematophila str. Anatoliense]